MKRKVSLLLLCLVLTACGAPTTDPWQEQYDLGVHYLSEGDYEEAIIAFTAAIEIDGTRSDALIGRADAYLAVGAAQGDYEAELRYYLLAQADYAAAAELGDASVAAKSAELDRLIEQLGETEARKVLLRPMAALLASDDTDSAMELARQEAYLALSDSITEGCFVLDESAAEVLAAYPDRYYYYGGWSDGQRSGEGVWFKSAYGEDERTESTLYRGAWASDLPNGAGTVVRRLRNTNANIPASSRMVATTAVGTFRDGWYDGSFSGVISYADGSEVRWSGATAADGYFAENAAVRSAVPADSYRRMSERGNVPIAASETPDTVVWGSTERFFVSGPGNECSAGYGTSVFHIM